MIHDSNELLGAVYEGEQRCRFTVWAPRSERVTAHLVAPQERWLPLQSHADGLHSGVFEGIVPGAQYFYDLGEGLERPDPASRFQPHGVHGPSVVIDPAFPWSDATFKTPALDDLVVYELHVGTFTDAGTFEAVVPHLAELAELGINAVELMPVAQFPGSRNWGYDGVYPFATQDSYGGPEGLKRLVDACHSRGLAVALDVVHNHLGPEGNYLRDFGPYFTDHYKTPWGAALNFDGPSSDRVRQFFIQSALSWVLDFHIDILRLDAIHAIVDTSADPFLRELARSIHSAAERVGRRVYVVAESDLNDPRVIRPPELGGLGMDAQWSDDFHHAVHAFMTGERQGYYADFGSLEDLARAYRSGYVYSGEFSEFRNRRHGSSPDGCPGRRFVVCTQNHDQIGNRAQGDRLSAHLNFAEEKVLACVLLLAPYVPLIFMGQEYGEKAPFQYFTSHGDPELVEAVRRGRRQEFAVFGWNEGDIPDPQDEATFDRSKLGRQRLETAEGHHLRELHRVLLRERRSIPAIGRPDRNSISVRLDEQRRLLALRRWHGDQEVAAFFAFGNATKAALPPHANRWIKLLDTEDSAWGGTGAPTPLKASSGDVIDLAARSCAIYVSS